MRCIFNSEDTSIAFEAEKEKTWAGKKGYGNKIRLTILCEHTVTSEQPVVG